MQYFKVAQNFWTKKALQTWYVLQIRNFQYRNLLTLNGIIELQMVFDLITIIAEKH